jgi:hypothetical protein
MEVKRRSLRKLAAQPIERVWKLTRRLCLHNVYFPKLDQVRETVERQFDQWSGREQHTPTPPGNRRRYPLQSFLNSVDVLAQACAGGNGGIALQPTVV